MFCEIVGIGAAIVFGVAILFLDLYAMYVCVQVMVTFFRDNANPWHHEDLVYSFVAPLCVFIFVMFLNIAATDASGSAGRGITPEDRRRTTTRKGRPSSTAAKPGLPLPLPRTMPSKTHKLYTRKQINASDIKIFFITFGENFYLPFFFVCLFTMSSRIPITPLLQCMATVTVIYLISVWILETTKLDNAEMHIQGAWSVYLFLISFLATAACFSTAHGFLDKYRANQAPSQNRTRVYK